MAKIDKELVEKLMGKRKPIKIKRKRKPMSAEQKEAAAERLKKAREARVAKNGPSKNSTYHESVYTNKNIDYKEVLKWYKNAKEQAGSYKAALKNKNLDNKQRSKNNSFYNLWDFYAANIQWYLRTGDWISDYCGENMGSKTKWTITASSVTSSLNVGDTWTIDDHKKIDNSTIIKKRKKKVKKNEIE